MRSKLLNIAVFSTIHCLGIYGLKIVNSVDTNPLLRQSFNGVTHGILTPALILLLSGLWNKIPRNSKYLIPLILSVLFAAQNNQSLQIQPSQNYLNSLPNLMTKEAMFFLGSFILTSAIATVSGSNVLRLFFPALRIPVFPLISQHTSPMLQAGG